MLSLCGFEHGYTRARVKMCRVRLFTWTPRRHVSSLRRLRGRWASLCALAYRNRFTRGVRKTVSILDYSHARSSEKADGVVQTPAHAFHDVHVRDALASGAPNGLDVVGINGALEHE